MTKNCLLNNCILLSYFMFCIELNNAYLNLYLKPSEVQRLLGIDAELYYVRDGNVNDYALNFVVPVPSKLNSLSFTWESLAGHPLPYSIAIETNSTSFSAPKFNISSTGSIPLATQIFTVVLPCSGTFAEEVDIIIGVNVTVSSNNITRLKIRRKKFCLKYNDQTNNNDMISHILFADNEQDFTPIFYAIFLTVLILLLCSTSFITICCTYYNKNKSLDVRTSNFVATVPRNTVNINSYGSFRRMPSYSLISERSKDLQERIAELTVQRCQVRLTNVIMEGTFGRVYKSTYTSSGGVEQAVIVKTVTDHASQVQISLLLQEGMSMYSLKHKNILCILRVSIEDRTAPFLLYPYNDNTNLKIFLQKCKLTAEGVSHTLTTQEVVEMALQILQALQYLHKKRLLHKDLATRNCVVDDKLRIQVTDNALSRDLFPSDYHCLGDNENRPVKWLAIESLVQKMFSVSSDVWSFGVLLWELTTLAQQPYIEIDPFEMASYLKDGYRLAQPINCPDELFAVMAYCWAMSIEERPTVMQLQVCLQDFYAQLIKYV